MNPTMLTRRVLPLLVTGLIGLPSVAWAEVKTFIIDQAQSPLTVAGSFASVAGREQGPGSLTTRFTGTILADVQTGTVEFVGASEIRMTESGPWEPGPGGVAGSPAMANLAGTAQNFLATAKGALRNVELDVTSPVIPVNGGSFDGQGMTFAFPSHATSAADYSVTGLLNASDTEPLAGRATNGIIATATLMTDGAELVLTLPIDLVGSTTVLAAGDLQYSAQGQILARATAAVPLQVSQFEIVPGKLKFGIATQPGQSYTVLGSTDLIDWSTVLYQFTAASESSAVEIVLGMMPGQFFRIRQD